MIFLIDVPARIVLFLGGIAAAVFVLLLLIGSLAGDNRPDYEKNYDPVAEKKRMECYDKWVDDNFNRALHKQKVSQKPFSQADCLAGK
jgi:hypothetical protein